MGVRVQRVLPGAGAARGARAARLATRRVLSAVRGRDVRRLCAVLVRRLSAHARLRMRRLLHRRRHHAGGAAAHAAKAHAAADTAARSACGAGVCSAVWSRHVPILQEYALRAARPPAVAVRPIAETAGLKTITLAPWEQAYTELRRRAFKRSPTPPRTLEDVSRAALALSLIHI